MSDHVYKKIDIIGTSSSSLEEAINNAVNRAAKTVKHLRWFEVAEIRGHIEDQKVTQYQVGLKIGFKIEDK